MEFSVTFDQMQTVALDELSPHAYVKLTLSLIKKYVLLYPQEQDQNLCWAKNIFVKCCQQKNLLKMVFFYYSPHPNKIIFVLLHGWKKNVVMLEMLKLRLRKDSMWIHMLL